MEFLKFCLRNFCQKFKFNASIRWQEEWLVRSIQFNGIPVFLCLWFRPSLIYINNCPTRCNTKQSLYYSLSSLYMFRVSTTPIIRSTQNCNYSLRYWSQFCAATSTSLQRGHVGGRQLMMGVVNTRNMPRVNSQNNKQLCVASRWTIINIFLSLFHSRSMRKPTQGLDDARSSKCFCNMHVAEKIINFKNIAVTHASEC